MDMRDVSNIVVGVAVGRGVGCRIARAVANAYRVLRDVWDSLADPIHKVGWSEEQKSEKHHVY